MNIMVTEPPEIQPVGYWYADEDSAVRLLQSVRRFRRADQEMRRRMSAEMDMNVTDLQALQHVIAAEGSHQPTSPRDISRQLHISTASTTKLVDRLTTSGHLRREPHPRDRRSVVLRATPHAHDEIRGRLTRMHERMAEVARAVPAGSRQVVIDFLQTMSDALDEQGPVQPLAPAPPRDNGPVS